MNDVEAARLLTVASGFDRRQVTEVTARAWALALSGFEYGEAEAAMVAHFRDTRTRGEYLEVHHVLDRLERDSRSRAADVEADVRSAKARGLVDASWPSGRVLPADVASALRLARDRDRVEAARHLAYDGGIIAGQVED